MMISDSLLEQIIEGALMASGHPLSVERIQSIFDEAEIPDKDRVEAALKRLGERSVSRGYELKKVATGYRFQVKENVVKWVSRLWEEKPQRYSRALMETLAIIAYRQPVTRGEIEDIRGVAVSSHITKTLLEREWVQVVGHRDVPGRPAMYATTKMFLDYFSMDSLEQLPTLEEIQEIADANHALELEDKVEEGDYDLSHTDNESEGEAALESAAEDLAAAEAIVQQVEENVFRKPEEPEEEETDVLETGEIAALPDIDNTESKSEKTIADLADAIGAHQDKLKEKAQADTDSVSKELSAEVELSDAEDALHNAIIQEEVLSPSEPEVNENQQAEMIAKMLAEQEALLAAKDSIDASMPLIDVDANDQEIAENSSVVEQENDLTDAPSVFGSSAPLLEEEDAEFQAAMEEEAIALLEAEQEELLALQDAEQSAQVPETDGEKSLADLANKLTTELD